MPLYLYAVAPVSGNGLSGDPHPMRSAYTALIELHKQTAPNDAVAFQSAVRLHHRFRSDHCGAWSARSARTRLVVLRDGPEDFAPTDHEQLDIDDCRQSNTQRREVAAACPTDSRASRVRFLALERDFIPRIHPHVTQKPSSAQCASGRIGSRIRSRHSAS